MGGNLDHIFLADLGLIIHFNLTFHQIPPVLTDHIIMPNGAFFPDSLCFIMLFFFFGNLLGLFEPPLLSSLGLGATAGVDPRKATSFSGLASTTVMTGRGLE